MENLRNHCKVIAYNKEDEVIFHREGYFDTDKNAIEFFKEVSFSYHRSIVNLAFSMSGGLTKNKQVSRGVNPVKIKIIRRPKNIENTYKF